MNIWHFQIRIFISCLLCYLYDKLNRAHNDTTHVTVTAVTTTHVTVTAVTT